MSFKWQDKHMELFLETYKQYECLWNNKCINYSKSNEREKAYLSMLNDLNIPGLTVGDVKAKIKTIRTRYGAELSKIRNSELNVEAGGTGEVYVPRLFWFKDADQFLRNVCAPKPNYFILKDQKEMSFETDQHTTQPYNGNDTEDSAENSNANANARYRKNELKRSLPTNNASVIGSPVKKLKPALEEEDDELSDQSINEFDYFCKSLAIQLKRMPLQRAIICQEKLQNVMTKERLFQLSEQYLSSLPVFDNDDDDDGIQNQSSEHNSVISSSEPVLHPIIDAQQFEMKLEDGSEYISEVKKEI